MQFGFTKIYIFFLGPPEEPAPATESPETRPLPPVATSLQPANPPPQPPVNWPGESEGREESADYCGDSQIDTIVSNDLGEVFVFKGKYLSVFWYCIKSCQI